MSTQATQNLAAIKGDVVNTIKGVVDVVGKYAGAALPEQARSSVKAFILSLPARWATVNKTPTSGAGARAANFGGSPVSPSFSPAHLSSGPRSSSPSSSSSSSLSHGSGAQQQRMAAAATAQAANRVLTLAVESLDILRSVTVVFGESLDRADIWVERLRVLGLQRKRQHEQAAQAAAIEDGEDEYGNRIEVGNYGSASPTPWDAEGNYDSRTERGMSPGADSNVSEGTSASSKRRRVKSSRTNSASHSQPSGTPSLAFSPSSTRRSSSSAIDNQQEEEETLFHQGSSSTIFSTLHDSAFAHSSSRSAYGHPSAGSSQTTRRTRTQQRSRPSSRAQTPNYSFASLPPSDMQRSGSRS